MMKRIITILFSVLFFAVPLVFFSQTSELFEFNKIVLLYAITLLISVTCVTECILQKKLIFRRSILDIPLTLFVGSQIISTLFSIDQRTSVFGYYSRFNGGLLSIFCYAILYWAFVTHIQKSDLPRLLLNICISTTISAIWGVLEHFGKSPSCLLITGNFDATCWVQDVQLRVFATFGQPNWMAAWMAAVIPLTWVMFFQDKKSFLLKASVLFLSALFFASLLFTKSKSGIAGFGIAFLVFVALWGIFHIKSLKKQINLSLLSIPLIFLFVCVLFGTPWTPSVSDILQKSQTTDQTITQAPTGSTALETGGTDSGEIRKIVWQGALNVWGQFPLFGSGVETFAFSYYRGRPLSHNLVSEWNFLYNKAHNEYLNYLATTGLVGFVTYLLVIGASLLQIWRLMKLKKDNSDFFIGAALSSGYISILITNFFGFSVVPISILFYLIPAVAVPLLHDSTADSLDTNKPDGVQTLELTIVAILFCFLSFCLVNYWRADYLYARAQNAQNDSDYSASLSFYRKAISLSPTEALYHAQLGSLYAELTTAKDADATLIETFINASKEELITATSLSPQNVRILKSVANSYATLGDVDPSYYTKTLELTEILQVLAPTDPSVIYQACLTEAKLNRANDAIIMCEKAVNMKPDYKIARRLLAFLYEQTKQPDKARVHLQYILKNISPDDVDIQKELQALRK